MSDSNSAPDRFCQLHHRAEVSICNFRSEFTLSGGHLSDSSEKTKSAEGASALLALRMNDGAGTKVSP